MTRLSPDSKVSVPEVIKVSVGFNVRVPVPPAVTVTAVLKMIFTVESVMSGLAMAAVEVDRFALSSNPTPPSP